MVLHHFEASVDAYFERNSLYPADKALAGGFAWLLVCLGRACLLSIDRGRGLQVTQSRREVNLSLRNHLLLERENGTP